VNQSLNAIDGLVSGVYNYSAYVKDDAGWSAITELRTVTVQLDTCTAPGAGQWELDCADNCNFTTTTTVPGNVNMSGSGNVYIGANWNFTGSNQYVYVWPGCEVDIYSGGGFNL